jgi:hypothetical protein
VSRKEENGRTEMMIKERMCHPSPTGRGLGGMEQCLRLEPAENKELKGRHGGYQCRVTDRLH